MDEDTKIVRKGTGFWMFLAGVVGFVYLLNPGAGFIELIPDNLPFVGNLDEAGATALLISAIAYFRKRKKGGVGAEPESEGERKVDAKVVESE